MLKFAFLFILAVSSFPIHSEESWFWLRAEAGMQNAVVMRGHATTLSKSKDKLVLRLSEDNKFVDDFSVSLHLSGSLAEAEFEPPNTEKIVLRVFGHYRQTATGDGTIYEEFTLANTQNGNFLLISRFRPKKTR